MYTTWDWIAMMIIAQNMYKDGERDDVKLVVCGRRASEGIT
jgi:hypothetical protein